MAGLVPGAHMGKGLGNRFLDDLRHADALIHVVDVSGTTDAEGQLSMFGQHSLLFSMTRLKLNEPPKERLHVDMILVRTLFGSDPKS